MAMESFATPYPVIFHDGEREHDKGHIGVHSVLTFKRCQSILSQKVGIPTSQLSIVFVCRRSDNKRQKLPINESTNFNIILNQHNPKAEKDCHFLVSMKKSKKERKGSRRRSAEAENGDGENGEDEYASPKRDLSPDCQICKGEIDGESVNSQSPLVVSEPGSPAVANPDIQSHTEEGSHEASPRSMLSGGFFQSLKDSPPLERPASNGSHSARVRSPSVTELSGQPLKGKSAEGSPPAFHQRLPLVTGPSDLKSNNEKILLRRDQANSVSPIAGWQNIKDKLVGPASSSQTDNMSVHVPARHPVGWLKSEMSDGRPTILQNDQKWVAGQPFYQQQAMASQTITTEGLQERFSDPSLTRSPVLLQRNGILSMNGPQSSPSLLHASRPLVFPPMDSMLLPRVSSGISGLASGTNAALNLQQAQAHYLSLQAQQSEQMYLNLQALSKMRGVVRGLAHYDNGNSHKPSGICQYCYKFQERKINPTPFHLCVHDRVTTGFRGPSPAGPIERPAKRVEAAA